MSIVAEQTYTPEDLLAMPDRKDYELVDGHLVERHMSVLSSWVAGRLLRFVDIFVEENQLGWAWPAGQGYVCFPDSPRKVRFPDVSFVRKDRLPEGLRLRATFTFLPTSRSRSSRRTTWLTRSRARSLNIWMRGWRWSG